MTKAVWNILVITKNPADRATFRAIESSDTRLRILSSVPSALAADTALGRAADILVAEFPPDEDTKKALLPLRDDVPLVWLVADPDLDNALSLLAPPTRPGELDERVWGHGILRRAQLDPSDMLTACVQADTLHANRLFAARHTGPLLEGSETSLAKFVIENSPAVVFRWHALAGSPVAYVSKNVSMFGFSAEEMMNERFFYQSIIHPDDLEHNLRRIRSFRETGVDRFVLEYRIVTKDAEIFWVEDNTTVVRNPAGDVRFHQGIVLDVTQKKKAQQQLIKLSEAVEQSPGSVVITDTRGRIEYVNRKFTEISGYDRELVVGIQLLAFNVSGDSGARKNLWNALWLGNDWHGEMKKARRDGEFYWEHIRVSPIRSSEGTITHFLEVGEDISERKHAEETIRRLAFFDSLTGLANRTLFNDRLSTALARAKRSSEMLAVLFIDLDKFKAINDSFGHSTGDEVLKMTADRLRACVRESDTIARLGGDEFMILLPRIADPADSGTVASKILDQFDRAFEVAGNLHSVTPSIGISTFPADGETAEDLMKNADAAMYRTKEAGKNGFQFFSGGFDEESVRRLTLRETLTTALDRQEFELYFQPVCDLSSGRIVSSEALLRWNHPVRGVLPPAEFVTLADESGMLLEIGRWVVRSACEAANRWRHGAAAGGFVTVNISAREAADGEFVPNLLRSLAETALDPSGLEIELNDPVYVRSAHGIALAATLRGHGIRVALGDFGEADWTLSSVKNQSVDAIKLDRRIVRGLPYNRDDAAIATAVVALTRALRIDVVAKGVETKEQLAYLRLRRCRYVQGFSICLPLPPEEHLRFLLGHNPAQWAMDNEDPNSRSQL